MSWAVVRVRGSVNVNPKIKETMKLMKLNRVNHCVIIPENDTYTGMLNIIKDYVTWGEIDVETTELLLQSSGKSSGNTVMRDVPGLKPLFRLHPPRKGYEGIKRSFKEGGALGYRAEKINALLRRMQYAQA